MRILVYSQFCGSNRLGMVYGSYYLARHWVEAGHEVEVVAASFSHTRSVQPKKPKFIYSKEREEGVDFIWLKTIAFSSLSPISKIVNIILYTFFSIFHALGSLFRRKVDIVVVSSHHPFAIIPGLISAKLNSSKLIYEVRDLWVESLVELIGFKRTNLIYLISKKIEDLAFRRADKIVSVLPNLESYLGESSLKTKLEHIPNAAYLDVAKSSQGVETVVRTMREIRETGATIVAYTGNVNPVNKVDELISLFSSLKNENVHLLIVGKGEDSSEYSHKYGLDKIAAHENIHYSNALPKTNLYALLDEVDACCLALADLHIYKYGVSPTKLNDYIINAKPTFILTGCNLFDITQIPGVVIESTKELLSQRILEFSRDKKLLTMSAEFGREWILENRSYTTLANKFLVF